MSESIGKVVYTRDDISICINRLATDINKYYQNVHEEVVCIVVMNGAFIFAADLLRKFNFCVSTEFMTLASYKGNISQSNVSCINTFDKNVVRNRRVLVIEDIIDTGKTFSFLVNAIKESCPKDLKICSLIIRDTTKCANVGVDYTGFTLDSKLFLVGYGMDYSSKYRNLPDIHELSV